MVDTNTRPETIEFTQELVRFPGLAGREREVAQAVEAKMRSLQYDEVRTDECGSVVGLRRGTQPGATVLFDSHTDTVEVTSPESWKHGPLSGDLADGKIWGRGSTDLKGALAATVVALGRLPASEFRGTVAVSASVGEEVIEGAALANIIAWVKPDYVVICEPTESKLGIGQKGRTSFWVRVKGRPAHTSTPRLGDNAVYKSLPMIERLRALELPKDELLGPGVMELVEIQSFPFPGKSIVPDGCRMRFDRRLTRDETMESVANSVKHALDGLRDWSFEYALARVDCYTGKTLQMPDFHAGWAMEPGSEIVQRGKAGLRSAGLAGDFYAVPYGTNGSYSAGEAKIPTVVFGPSTIKLAHAIDEYIEVEELLRGTEGFVGLARALTSS